MTNHNIWGRMIKPDKHVSNGAAKACTATLGYPAPRCGAYVVYCETCDLRIVVSTAGRPDDPRSVKVACKPARTQ